MQRRRFLCHASLLLLPLPVVAAPGSDWPLWSAFLRRFVQDDGRVIEPSANGRTTSEGQAYALFFALVANDSERFRRILGWAERNLARNDLARHFPAWLWGRNLFGRWRVLDENSATDANLWLAYALLEAGRLWDEPGYAALGRSLLARSASETVAALPGLGPMLLPAPRGFAYSGGLWRINPSYLVPQHLRLFAAADPSGPWSGIAELLPSMMRSIAPAGIVPDWTVYHAGVGWQPDRESKGVASYDAVRAYLWAGMMADQDPLREPLLEAQRGMLARLDPVDGRLPEKIDARTGAASGTAPPGFSAALLPWLAAQEQGAALNVQRRRLAAAMRDGLVGSARNYYDQVLLLFGLGWDEQRYRFDLQGRLVPGWAA